MHRNIFLIVFAAFVSVTLLVAASHGFERGHARNVYYDYLDQALLAPKAVNNDVAWSSAETRLARPFTPVDERNIGKAISEAWGAFAVAQDIGETAILPDYFTGVALERARVAAAQGHAAGTAMVVLQTKGRPEFYHLDGSVFQARLQSLGVRFAANEDGLPLFHATRDTTITTLMNESSGWRVFSHERLSAEPLTETIRTIPDMRLAGVNYYPAQTPWRAFWREFEADVIAADFDRIAALGGNAVRVFLPREPFLGQGFEGHRDNLVRLLDMASERDLRVIPTLFDLKGGYALAAWSDDATYLGNVLGIVASHDAVAFVDIKNEPDLDFEAHGKARVEAWLRTMILLCRDMAPALAVTVGWSAAEHAPVVAEHLDLITYHEYQPMAGTAQRLAEVRAIAGDKPVMITEIGESTWSAFAGWPGSPSNQAADLSARLMALAEAEGVFVWTLHDFPNPDPLAVGSKPWVRKTQSEFGLFDNTGTAKPAAKTVADWFSTFTKGNFND